jgi:short-subunit dehydrogenase
MDRAAAGNDLFLAGTSAAVTGAGAGIGDTAFGMPLDITEPEPFTAFLDAAERRHGPLGVMVNNAGVDWVGPFHQEPDEVTRREIAVNLYGTTLGSKLALERMLARRHGHLVNIASGAGRVPLPGSATYAATKHGVVGLTESLRLEYRGRGIAFTVVQPSQVRTAMIDGQAQPRALPVVTPEDVAGAVLDALRHRRFEVWVPRSQGTSARLGNLLPRPARDLILRALGVTRIAGDFDAEARREYHARAFGRS